MNHYVIKDVNGTTVVIDWLEKFNKCGLIESFLDFDNRNAFPKSKNDQMKKNVYLCKKCSTEIC
jgi:hypothetical protein